MFGIDPTILAIVLLVAVSTGAVAYGVLFSRIETDKKTSNRINRVRSAETDTSQVKAARDRVQEVSKRRKSVQDSLKELEKKHLELNSKREKLEKERNVIGLKVQKIKDRVIPKIQKIAQKHLGEYEDLFSADVKDGKVVIQKFSHLAEWKRVWESQHKK
jgi:septal ring factor EnvC (AmiA/AmiB activator)